MTFASKKELARLNGGKLPRFYTMYELPLVYMHNNRPICASCADQLPDESIVFQDINDDLYVQCSICNVVLFNVEIMKALLRMEMYDVIQHKLPDSRNAENSQLPDG